MIRFTQLFFIILLLPVTLLASTIPQERLDNLDKQLTRLYVEHHVPGLAIAVVCDDEIIFMKGYGLADIAKNKPVTEKTVFAIGSATKAFTSALIAIQVDKEKMEWDAPVTRYLPEFNLQIDTENPGDEVLLTDLLSHQTGFTRMGILWVGGEVTADEVLETATRAKPMAPFRKQFLYNNVTYMAAGRALEEATGKSWHKLMKRDIFKPLKMKNSTTSVKNAKRNKRLALGYIWDEDTRQFEHLPMRKLDTIAPSGAINSTVRDMAQWVRFQLQRGQIGNKTLIERSQFNEMWSGRITISDGTFYALGWMVHDSDGDVIVEHGGNIDGFSSSVAFKPQENIGYVMLTNVSMTPLQAMHSTVFDALLQDPSPENENGSELAKYIGKYIADFGSFQEQTFDVFERDGALYVDVPSQTAYQLKPPDENGRWVFALTNTIEVSFEEDPLGNITALRMHQNGLDYDLPREGVEIPIEIPLYELEPLLGVYKSDPGSGVPECTVLIKNNRLAVDVPGQMIYELEIPGANGVRAFRVKGDIGVSFGNDGSGSETMTLHQNGMQQVFRRVAQQTGGGKITLQELDDKRGTREAGQILAGLGNIKMVSTVQLEQSGIDATSTLWFAGSDRCRAEVDYGKFGWSRSSFIGSEGWYDSSYEQFKQLTGQLFEQTRQSHPGWYLGDWHHYFDDVRLKGHETLDGRDVYVVLLKNGDLPAATAWVDAGTGDIVQTVVVTVVPGVGQMSVETDFSEFQEVSGLRVPHHMVTSTVFTGRMVETVTSVETNLKIENSAFRMSPPQ